MGFHHIHEGLFYLPLSFGSVHCFNGTQYHDENLLGRIRNIEVYKIIQFYEVAPGLNYVSNELMVF